MQKWKSAASAGFKLSFTSSVFHSETNLTNLRKAQEQGDEWAGGTRDNGLPKGSTNLLAKGRYEGGCGHMHQGWEARQDGVVYSGAEEFTREWDRMPTCRKIKSVCAGQLRADRPRMLTCPSKSQLKNMVRAGKILWWIHDLILHLMPKTSNLCVWGICWFFF